MKWKKGEKGLELNGEKMKKGWNEVEGRRKRLE